MRKIISSRKTSVQRILFSLICTFLFFSMVNGKSIIHAEDTGSITINTPTLPTGVSEIDPANKPSYTVYKIFDGNSNGANIRYTLPAGKSTTDPAWTSSQMGTYFDVDVVGNVKIKEGAYTSVDGKQYLTDDAVKAVGAYVTAARLTGTPVAYDANNNSYKLSGLSDGYYYINTSTGSVVMIDSINGSDQVTVQDKNVIPSVDKKQTTDVDSNGAPKDYKDDDVNVATGDTIYYEAIVNVPSGIDEDIVLSDHLSVAFIPNFEPVTTGDQADDNTAIQDDDIAVQYQDSNGTWQTLEKGNATSPNYVITANWTADDKSHIHGFTVHIKPTDATKGKTLRFLYSATVGGGFMNDNNQDKDASANKLIDQKRNKIELMYKTYRQEDKVFFHTDCAGAIKYDTSTGNVDPSTNILSAKEGKTLKYLPDARFKLQERLKSNTSINNNEWTDTPVVCNGQREFYRPAVLNAQETKTQGKWIGADGDNVLDYQSKNNGFIQANEGEYTDKYNRGWIVFRGLDPDKQYRLVECSAPDGYNRLTTPVVLNQVPDTKFKVSLHNSAPGEDGVNGTGKHEEFYWKDKTEFLEDKTVVKIGNTPGVALPTTGGAGTVVFYLAGGVLIIAAAALLITRHKRNA